MRIVGCKSVEGTFVVQRVKSVDKLVAKGLSYETEAIQGQSDQHLRLRAVRPLQADSMNLLQHDDVHLYTTLTYSYDDDHKTRGPLMPKPTLRQAPSPMVMDVDRETLLQQAATLVDQIVADLDSDMYYTDPSSRHAADKIDMLRRVLVRIHLFYVSIESIDIYLFQLFNYLN